jgi:hypothetical protein
MTSAILWDASLRKRLIYLYFESVLTVSSPLIPGSHMIWCVELSGGISLPDENIMVKIRDSKSGH